MIPQRHGCLLLGSLVLAACAGGPSFRDGIYEDEHARYRVGALPAGFRRAHVEGNDLAFHRDDLGTISVNSTCEEYDDVPATALINHLLFGTTERRFVTEEDTTLDGRGARHVVVQVGLDGVPVELEIFLVVKDGCVFDLTHIRSRTAPAEARAVFRAFVERFAVLSVHVDG